MRKIVKVSRKTDPKQLATSMLYSLKEGYEIEAVALGESIIVLTKALCMMNMFKEPELKIDFQPKMKYVKDQEDEIKNSVSFTINLIE